MTNRMRLSILSAATLLLAAPAFAQNWVNYSNQTSTRLVGATSVIGANNLEKDMAWGDLDRDGDVDLVVMM